MADDRLGLRTVIDLREDVEREQRPNRIDGVGARIVALTAVRAAHVDARAYLVEHGVDPVALDALQQALTSRPTAAPGDGR